MEYEDLDEYTEELQEDLRKSQANVRKLKSQLLDQEHSFKKELASLRSKLTKSKTALEKEKRSSMADSLGDSFRIERGAKFEKAFWDIANSSEKLSVSSRINTYLDICRIEEGEHWVSSTTLRSHFIDSTGVETNPTMFGRIFAKAIGAKSVYGGADNCRKGYLLNREEFELEAELKDPLTNRARRLLKR